MLVGLHQLSILNENLVQKNVDLYDFDRQVSRFPQNSQLLLHLAEQVFLPKPKVPLRLLQIQIDLTFALELLVKLQLSQLLPSIERVDQQRV